MFGVPGTMQPGYTGTITNFQIVLNTQLNTCQNFPAQKNPQIKHRRTPPPPTPWDVKTIIGPC